MEATGLAVDLFGGGSIAGRNISTGIWGGQIHSKNISINTYDNAGRLTVKASSGDAVIFQDRVTPLGRTACDLFIGGRLMAGHSIQ